MAGSHLLHQQFYAENGGVDHSRINSLNSYHFRDKEAEWYRSKGCYDVKVRQSLAYKRRKERTERLMCCIGRSASGVAYSLGLAPDALEQVAHG